MLDVLSPSRLSGGSVGNPGIAEVEIEEKKKDKFKGHVEKCYLFQPLALEAPMSAGPSTEKFLKELCQFLCFTYN